MFSRVPAERIRTLALDEGSRTSVALLQILLDQQFGVRPDLSQLPLGATLSDADTDAVLLIGDRAIRAVADGFDFVWDLGDEWYRWSDLPFVFAMWTAREGRDLRGVELALNEARDAGLRRLKQIAAEQASKVGLSEHACLSYLRDNLHFRLGPQERQGLELFRDHAVGLGLAPPNCDLKFHDCTIAR
jgi:chorismate dehydratase